MIRFLAVTAFALAVATSAQAMSLAPLHQPDGMVTHGREACGVGMHYRSDLGRCVTTPARRQARRCLVWGAGHVCCMWGWEPPRIVELAWSSNPSTRMVVVLVRGIVMF